MFADGLLSSCVEARVNQFLNALRKKAYKRDKKVQPLSSLALKLDLTDDDSPGRTILTKHPHRIGKHEGKHVAVTYLNLNSADLTCLAVFEE